ncbi:hypothetical protein PSTG_18980, partial [Puccinia striiformis f. sp. tritici PST-78]
MALVNFEHLNTLMETHNASWMVGVGLVIVFGLLNAFGIEAFGKAEIVLTFAMWSTLVIFGIAGLLSPPHAVPLEGWFGSTLSLSDPFSVAILPPNRATAARLTLFGRA